MPVSESFYLSLLDEVTMQASMRVHMKCPACGGSILMFIVPDQHIHTVPLPEPKMFGMGKAYADCEMCKHAGKPYRFESIFTVATTVCPEIFTEAKETL